MTHLTNESRTALLSLESWLTGRLAALLDADAATIAPTASFTDLGVTSLQAMELAGDLEDRLGAPLPPTLLYDHPTVEALAEFAAGFGPVPGPGR